eukprot:CAMPEP_0194384338 /NCGR_PEP_ID=MMETSP0174-20130528/73352_1 /TAXON_ID=216777 /ORGANISM="Proboscia alata, Strain PI-D3" /LENGTH=59 /DNA_ID=CAMNT_0039171433 /DNA_START=67 /DNA_END=246 /DNA_ORIENTATION=-
MIFGLIAEPVGDLVPVGGFGVGLPGVGPGGVGVGSGLLGVGGVGVDPEISHKPVDVFGS